MIWCVGPLKVEQAVNRRSEDGYLMLVFRFVTQEVAILIILAAHTIQAL